MSIKIADEIILIVEETSKTLRSIDEEFTRKRPAPGKWSISEILGHLIDSVANNHQRVVRAQLADVLIFPAYQQNEWVFLQSYNTSPWHDSIELWRLYNRHFAHVIKQVLVEKLETQCKIGPPNPVTLGFIIEDYLEHLKHHIKQIEDIISI